MHVLFEVFVTRLDAELLTEETIADTHAQAMTPEQAEAVGLSGMPEDPEGRQRILIVVRKSDQGRIAATLEQNPDATGFRVHDVEL